MFTAAEARKLTDQASGKYETICEKFGLKVKELADTGKNDYAIYEEGFWNAMSIWEMQNPATESQRLLMSLLRDTRQTGIIFGGVMTITGMLGGLFTGSIQNILIPFEMEGSDCMGQIVFFGKTHGPGFEVLRLESEGFSDFI